EALDEGGAFEDTAGRHPRATEAGVRHSDGSVAQRRPRPPPAGDAVRGIGRGAWIVSLSRRAGADRRPRRQPDRRHRSPAHASQLRDLGSYLHRRTSSHRSRGRAESRGGMKMLVVCHRFPYPPKRGGKIRPFNIIRHLSRSHEVTVASIVRSEQEAQEGEGLSAYCARYEMTRVSEPVQALRMAAQLPTIAPSSMGYFYSGRLARRIDDLLRREPFDVVFVHCSSVAHYVDKARGSLRILDYGDMDSQKWREYSRYKPFPLSLGYGI